MIKAYDDSIKLAREELARRIALSTSVSKGHSLKDDNSKDNSDAIISSQIGHKVGEYVRATYEDGVDYEAKIISIDENAGTCLLKYIGYENEQEVALSELIASWGKKSRRLQFAKAKLDADTDQINAGASSSKTSKKNKTAVNLSTIPPPPPMPPMLTATQNAEDSEHLSAMLMSWYMSGYYTGVYQGMQMAKAATKAKKQ